MMELLTAIQRWILSTGLSNSNLRGRVDTEAPTTIATMKPPKVSRAAIMGHSIRYNKGLIAYRYICIYTNIEIYR